MKKISLNMIIVIGGLLFVLLTSTLLVTRFKPLYSYSIEILNIDSVASISKEEMVENYSYVVDYLFNSDKEFHLPTLDYSEDGAVHFWEVKQLFTLAIYAVFGLAIILFITIFIYIKSYGDIKYLKYLGGGLMSIPLALTLIVSFNFNYFFTIFHKIFFNNDKWLFDPRLDPIINILPEEFFALCGGSIILLTVIIGILVMAIYKILQRKQRVVS